MSEAEADSSPTIVSEVPSRRTAPRQEWMLRVWQEICRHVEISESTAVIARLLKEVAPLQRAIVRQIDRQRGLVETLADTAAAESGEAAAVRTTLTSRQLQQLEDSWRRQRLRSLAPGDSAEDVAGCLLPADAKAASALVGLLTAPRGFLGVLILIAPPGERFSPEHEDLATALLEPFSAALENDLRLREVAALRAAAEADKESLLHRLGRKEVTESVVGAEAGLSEVMERVELVTRSDVTVLLLGETGTGKELIARVIHSHSARAGRAFLRVNCGAIPAELIDSELFGHERGAFTGATETRPGWFERADGGTLLLDEVGELTLAAQVRLLRILQDGWLERVGGRQPIHVDVRIVAATHRNLATMVSEGRFREDLWYRLAVFPIFLPPLRQRPEDIPALAVHFAERAAVRFTLPLVLPSDEDIALLGAYPWPGNIRELGAVIDRAAILGNGERLEVGAALGLSAQHAPPAPAVTQPSGEPPRFPKPVSFEQILSLDEAMKRHIEAALHVTKGRIEGRRGAAAALKINPHTLRARMRKLGIDWNRFRQNEE